ncbi:pyridoxal phosphate-dependent aminotransferase [Actinomadura sp. KC216]|uniref:pyridoxal phosphate-dependent aminotransferase n=1 Tax=Actinomadura sp. KC216 TaxID=2530370 RepID=UPI001047CC7E|nr:pyridoxal phosphate-dependent aminotransferase [Actinomadura sp. KC216]TDB78400.1 pyridoxal phosphate-dependent aminotransferase [Actinomadura sp. KC216]
MTITSCERFTDISYELRGPVTERAARLKGEGHHIFHLHSGNPAAYGFEPPDEIVQEIARNLSRSHGYSDAQGILPARQAVVRHYERRGFGGLGVEDVYLGNGVSELIMMALQAMLNDGDEVLIPTPDYPLWSSAVALCGGTPVHYLCDENRGWCPDLPDMESKISPATRAVVVINPNNPTGAVYPRELLAEMSDLARRHRLVVLADEIYEQIRFDGAEHVPIAPLAPDVPSLTFSGLSKAYRVCGYRSGWMVLHGAKHRARSYIEALGTLADMRLCPNLPGQHAVPAALEGPQSVRDLVLPGGRLHLQRDRAWELLNAIPGVSCVKPKGALYLFPRLDPHTHRIDDDQELAFELLENQHVLVVPGSGFNWPAPDHLRITALPRLEELEPAIGRLADLLSDRAGGRCAPHLP